LRGRTIPPRVLIVVLNWNGAGATAECVRCVRRLDYPAADLLVIDNGSRDHSAAVLRDLLTPPERLLALRANRGFAGGMNVGLREARAGGYAYAWLLNNDAFPAPDCLTALVGAMEAAPRVVLATPRLVGADGREQHAGGTVDLASGALSERGAAELCGPAAEGTWLTGTAVLVRSAGLGRVGLFDPRFFAYWEDVDLCTRVLKAGGDLRAVPAATCRHLGAASTGGKHTPFATYMNLRNTWLFLRKHAPRRGGARARLRLLRDSLETAGVLALQGDARAPAIVAALADALGNRYGRPAGLRAPPLVERLVLRHPWRVIRLLDLCDRLMTPAERRANGEGTHLEGL
jgi:GT2 family glycosyltransferase